MRAAFLLAAAFALHSAAAQPVAGEAHFLSYGKVHSVAFSPDGRLLATAGSAGIALIELESGSVVQHFPPAAEGVIAALAFSPAGDELFALLGWGCSLEQRLVRWELASGQADVWTAHSEPPAWWQAANSALAGVSCQPFWSWSWDTGEIVGGPGAAPTEADSPRTKAVQLLHQAGFDQIWDADLFDSESGVELAIGLVANSGEVVAVDSVSGRVVWRHHLPPVGEERTQGRAALDPGKNFLTVVFGSAVRLLDPLDGRVLASYQLPAGDLVWSVVDDVDHRRSALQLIPAGFRFEYFHDWLIGGYRVVILPHDSGRAARPLYLHSGYPTAMSFTEEGHLRLLNDRRSLLTFELGRDTVRLLEREELEPRPTGNLTFIENGTALLASSEAPGGSGLTVRVIPLEPGAPSHSDALELLIDLPGGQLAQASRDQLGSFVATIRGDSSVMAQPLSIGAWERDVATDRQGARFAIRDGSRVRLFSPDYSYEVASRLESPNDPPTSHLLSLRFARRGSRLIGYTGLMPAYCYECYDYGAPTGFWLWDTATGDLLVSVPMPDAGTPLATDFDTVANAHGLRDLETGTLWCEWPVATSVALSPALIATGTEEGEIFLYDAENCAYLGALMGHTDRIENLLFGPSGELLVSSSRDGSVRAWPILTENQQ